MRHTLYIICLAFFVFGCSNNSSDDTQAEEENPDGNSETVSGVKLYFPQEDTLCNEGANLTPTESTVYFEWEASNNNENYTIVVENLLTGNIIQQETTDDIIPIVILRATPYKWYVEFNSGGKTEKSETWQFYNAGPGAESYIPFPATINAPTMAQSIATASSVTLQWTGTDLDGDIVGYDVYFGTSNEPSIFSSDLTATELSISVSANTIYYWKIITKDEIGHASDSGIFQFKVL